MRAFVGGAQYDASIQSPACEKKCDICSSLAVKVGCVSCCKPIIDAPTASLRENMRQLPRRKFRGLAVSPISHVTLRWEDIAVLVALALLFLGAVSSIIKVLRVRRNRLSSGDVPESDYYKVDIGEGEKQARGEQRD